MYTVYIRYVSILSAIPKNHPLADQIKTPLSSLPHWPHTPSLLSQQTNKYALLTGLSFLHIATCATCESPPLRRLVAHCVL